MVAKYFLESLMLQYLSPVIRQSDSRPDNFSSQHVYVISTLHPTME